LISYIKLPYSQRNKDSDKHRLAANYFSVPEIPKLGTGKVDLRGLKQLATACMAEGVRV
jgi:hypothetical protein